MNCTWTIEVKLGDGLKLTTVNFSLEEGHDRLLIYKEYPVPDAILIGEYRGRDIPQEILVTSNLIHLVLITDNSATEGGFKIHYKAFFLLRPPCFNPGVPENGLREGNSFDVGEFVSFRCDDGFTLKGRAILSCMSGYQMGWDGPLPTCKAECGGYRTTHAPGFIYSPNYPGQYGNNMNCTWTIEANLRQGEGIGMKIEKFSLEEGHDRLLIYDGDPISDSTLFGEYSGQEIPREVNSTSHIIHLVLITDESGSEDGFTINYEGFPLTDDSGCPDFRSIENGSIGKFEDGWILNFEDKHFPLGSTIPFRCDKWNYLRGPSEITCMPGGIWSSRPPTCEDATWCHGQRIVDEEEGEIKSPRVDLGRGLYNYPNNVDCSWTISVDPSQVVVLDVLFFRLEYHARCFYDWLSIVDFPYTEFVQWFCGWVSPHWYHSMASTLVIHFHSDERFNEEGFTIFHSVISRDKSENDAVIYRTGFSAKYETVWDRSDSKEPSAPDVLQSEWLKIGEGIKQISVSTSTNQVWALDIDGRPLRRTGISKSAPQGTGWEVVQNGTEQFLHISVGRAGVWAVSDDSTVMYRVGTFRSEGTSGTSWQTVHIDSKITSSLFNFKAFPVEIDWSGHKIDRIHSGKDFVWIIASYSSFTYGYTIVRKGITWDNPVGAFWESIQTANMKEVSVSSRTGQLWAVELGGRVWRSPFYCEISVKRDWEAIDGCFLSVSVGLSGVWAVDFEGKVHHRAGTFLNETARGVAWMEVPGVPLQEVHVGDGIIWGVDSSHRVFVKLLPTSLDGKICQVGLNGRSMCYATEEEKRLCAEDEVICPYSERCIKECSVCDGILDCGDDDDTDERNCWFAACPEKHRRMCHGEVGCYSPIRVCDGERNCGKVTEDERDCPDSCVDYRKRNYLLQREEIQCRDLTGCVKITKVCDGRKDCSDGSDEINCDEFCSLHGSFGDAAYWKCRDAPGCVKGDFLCNGISDCADRSDEQNCDELCRSIGYWPCKNSIPPFPRCINGQGRCNRAVQCRDFSDEIGCDYCGLYEMAGFPKWKREIFMEGTDMLYLLHEVCIPLDSVCDGWNDWYFQDEVSCFQGMYEPNLCERCPIVENTCFPFKSDILPSDSLSSYIYCDTIIHCDNGEDEMYCSRSDDDTGMYKYYKTTCEQYGGWDCTCDQGSGCYVPKDICDARQQCHSLVGNDCHGDEQFCEDFCHTVDGFDCGWPWNQCISKHLVCDMHPDCEYMDNATLTFYGPADEQNCGTCDGYWHALEEYKERRKEKEISVSDKSYNHICSLGKCGATFHLCDDRDFCGNWEDEQDCEVFDCLHDERKCEATKKCPSDLSCNGVPGCLDSTDENDCSITTCMDTAVRLGVSDQHKEIGVTQNCDGKEDCRTGVDENPRRCAMYADRLPCLKSNRFVSENSFCDGFPDCYDASDEDACIGIKACLLPISLLVDGYTFEEGIGASHSHHEILGLSMVEWVVDSMEDWLQITLENPVQLSAIVISGSRSYHPPSFTLRYGHRADCLATYMEREEVKVFTTSEVRAHSHKHYLAIAVHTTVVKLTLQPPLDMAVLDVGLLGCPIKEQRLNEKSCGKGWTMFQESCYQMFTSPLVWWAAERYCQAVGGHLASVNTPQENTFLRSNIGNGWIGMKLDAVVMKKQREKIDNFTWSNGSPTGNAFKKQDIELDAFQEYLRRLNDPFCASLELHGLWSLQPCSLVEREFICEKDPSSYGWEDGENAIQCLDTDMIETAEDEINSNIPDMTVCDDCMARETSCGNIRCGLPDDYRCGLIYSPGYPTAFPPSVICLWTIDGPPGSYVTLLLLDVDLPGNSGGVCTSRVLQIRDRFLAVRWNTIHGLCRGEDEQKLYVSSSNDMQLAMLATSNSAEIGGTRGFMATFNISTFIPSRQVDKLPHDAGFICPCGWHLFRRNCYQTLRHNVPLSWVEADVKCREYGANLTSIAHLQEMEFLHVLLVTNVVVKRIADPKLFIGLHDAIRNRTFVWTDGSPVTFTDWSLMDLRTGFPQPDGAKLNYCVAIVMKNVWGTDQWYDVPCDQQDTRSFICKQKAERVTRPGNNG
ncbi:uncharacterized protein LOC144875296 isoform X2 [Branchiostoma floridae x Branchiostoma japonicum]